MLRRRNDAGPPQVVRDAVAQDGCLPWELLAKRVGHAVSRAWMVQWLGQRSVAPLLGSAEAAVLLFQLVGRIRTSGYADISSRRLRSLTGRRDAAFDRDRAVLTAPWTGGGERFPPLFRIVLGRRAGPGFRRKIYWVPLAEGWAAFIEMLLAADKAIEQLIKESYLPRKQGRYIGGICLGSEAYI